MYLPRKIFTDLVLLSLIYSVYGWDNEELELFDLVDEVNQNFYELLDVKQDASSSEIRRAYRKLSLQLHPDKNKEADAEVKFRQLVAVYEVLKDETQRERYNNVMVNGLPDWRQPVFYYRRVRKMGLIELAVLLMVIFTVGHFLVIWSVYLERRFEQEEVFRSKKKREKRGKKARQQQSDCDVDELLQEQLDLIPRPKLTDVLPLKMVRGVIYLIMSAPAGVAYLRYSFQQMRVKEAEEEETDEASLSKPRRQRVQTPDADYRPGMSSYQAPVGYTENTAPLSETGPSNSPQQSTNSLNKEWGDDDLAMLAKAVSKFPGGTSDRWTKISEFVGRPEKQVISMANKVKVGYVRSVDKSAQGITGQVTEDISFKKGKSYGIDDHMISTRDSDWSDAGKTVQRQPVIASSKQSKNKGLANKPQAAGDGAATCGTNTKAHSVPSASPESNHIQDDNSVWSQNQQKILEWCLNQYPRGTAARWEKISEHIPGKSKEECVARFRYLAEMVKQRKQGSNSS